MKKNIILLYLITSIFTMAKIKDVNHKWCPPKKEVIVEEKKVKENITLNISADALFKFDKYMLKDMLLEGRKKIDEAITIINEEYTSVEEIYLEGHTDRMGTVAYNIELGLNRAKTVREYIINNGVSIPIKINSFGESQPVTDGCYNLKAPKETTDGRSITKVSEELRKCLQPDRRVTIKFKGFKVIDSK